MPMDIPALDDIAQTMLGAQEQINGTINDQPRTSDSTCGRQQPTVIQDATVAHVIKDHAPDSATLRGFRFRFGCFVCARFGRLPCRYLSIFCPLFIRERLPADTCFTPTYKPTTDKKQAPYQSNRSENQCGNNYRMEIKMHLPQAQQPGGQSVNTEGGWDGGCDSPGHFKARNPRDDQSWNGKYQHRNP
ncbi:hypothetical protein CS176_0581 [Corynebacterium glutamicum]|nr:hypothetical protein CS176_0581 [Corynebacterium glutamicum]